MKFFLSFFICFIATLTFSQEKVSALVLGFEKCKEVSCKIDQALLISEYYLEIDDIAASQKWLNRAKNSKPKNLSIKQQYLINSLQSELFYYMGLYQFGLHEAQKGVEISKEMNDSLYIANSYLMEGINYFEIPNINKSEKALQLAKNYFPQKNVSKNKRFQINKEYIFNNIAQLKLKISQLDSCYIYNKKAYGIAQKSANFRCIANVERTFGELFMKKSKTDSAQVYFEKSVATSIKAKIYDTALLGYSNLMQSTTDDAVKINVFFNKGQQLIEKYNVNMAFQKQFYQQALPIYKLNDNKKMLLSIQEKLLFLDQKINSNGNIYIQNITNQYINSENKLLQSKINDLDKQKNIRMWQLLATLFFVLILLLAILIIRRKNKLQKSLLDQKNEISKDLHDDIGSGISSILIHADLLLKNSEASEKQKFLASKINSTGKEVSQRMNTFIWSLNADNNSLRHFVEYVKNYAITLFEGTAIQIVFSEDNVFENQIKINGTIRKNLFFCIKEILNNSLKHSSASEINFNLKLSEKHTLIVQIHDNGTGLKKDNIFGNGLKNIQNRVDFMDGKFTTKNDGGLFTEITIQIGF